MWLGGLMMLTRFMKLLTVPQSADSLRAMIKRIYFAYVIPGMTLSILSGLYQLSSDVSGYMQRGWFHGKLTFVLLLLGITFVVATDVKRSERGELLSAGRLGALHGLTGLALIAILSLTLLFR